MRQTPFGGFSPINGLVLAACTLAPLSACERDQSDNPPGNPDQDSAAAPAAIASAEPWFVERAVESGLVFRHDSGHRDRCLFPEIVCGGAALFDMDNDGDLDAYLVQSGSLNEPASARPGNQLFRNNGDGSFTDVSAKSGADNRGYGMGVTTGDFDNDGDLDLYVTNVGPNVLLRNDGNGRFTDVTSTAGVGDSGWGSSAAFVDIDRDGDLDLFVANYIRWSLASERTCINKLGLEDYCSPGAYDAPMPDVLYRNNGDGTFADVSAVAGLHTAFGNGLGVVCADFNDDRWPDVFVANDQTPNQLWINQKDGTFRDLAPQLGCAVDLGGIAKAGMGVAAADLDHDLDIDLLVVNLRRETDSLFLNEGRYFTDATAAWNLTLAPRPFTRFGVGLHDFDHDGLLDLYETNGRVVIRDDPLHQSTDTAAEPNLLMKGRIGGGFDVVSPPGGTSPTLIATSRAAAFGDIDNDGDIDILVANRDGPAHLLVNQVGSKSTDSGRRWIMFRLIDRHGRDAIGATVRTKVGDRIVSRDVRTAYSYCAANDPRVHLGLGDVEQVSEVTVLWPDGSEQKFGPQVAGQIVEIRQRKE